MDIRIKETEGRATLANWRTEPFSRWAFHHVREILPTAEIAADRDAPEPFRDDPRDLSAIAFEGKAGGETTVGRFLADSHTDALVVLQGDRVLAEWNAESCAPALPHVIFSISKSVTGCLAGCLAAEGIIDPDEPAGRYIPEAAGGAYGDCSIRHILDMAVDIAFEEVYLNPDGDYARYREATGWNPIRDAARLADQRSFLLTLKRAGKPHGHAFHYVSPNSDFLGWLLERAAGRPYADLVSDYIWRPMGARSAGYVTVDRLGAARAAGGVCVTARDLALLGVAMRDGGAVAGRQVIPRDWVEDIRNGGDREAWLRGEMADLLPAGRYRSKWYQIGNPAGAFCGIGIHGQWLYVDPAADAVIVKLSSQPEPVDDPLDRACLRAFDAICRALEKG